MPSDIRPAAVTRRDLARMRVLAELNAGGQLALDALLRRLALDPAIERDEPLMDLLRELEHEGMVTAAGHPRRYYLRLAGRIELHTLIKATSADLARRLSPSDPLQVSVRTAGRAMDTELTAAPRPSAITRQAAPRSAQSPRAPPP